MFFGSLRVLIPAEHVLARVDRRPDLGWLRAEVAECYAAGSGRPAIDPEEAVRLMLAGRLIGIVRDRRLMREAAVNIAIRRFAGYGLTEALPDHSSLTCIRQRSRAERFRRLFTRTVEACVAAGIAKGEVVHIESSLVRADVSWKAIGRKHPDAVEAVNGPAEPVCRTDPDASLATNNCPRRAEPAYEQPRAVDADAGEVLDVAVTTGAHHDSKAVAGQLDASPATTGVPIGIEAVIPATAEQSPKRGNVPVRRFKLDAKHRVVRCPAGKVLRPHRVPDSDGFQHYRARIPDCEPCRLRTIGFSTTIHRRAILLNEDHSTLLPARRKYARWGPRERALYRRHRGVVEGIHGEATSWHGLARAIRRGIRQGLANMQIQAFLTADVNNLQRPADAVLPALLAALGVAAAPADTHQRRPAQVG